MLFDDLKKSLTNSIKDQVVNLDQRREIKNFVMITDNSDDVDRRVENAVELNEKLGSTLSKIYLYDVTHFLAHADVEKSWIVEALKEHSTKIKSLKGKDYEIILEETVKAFLLELRDIRHTTESQVEEFALDEVEALAEFLVNASIRQRNFVSSIKATIKEINPELLYWKPPLLEERKISDDDTFLRNFSTSLLRDLPSDKWIYLEGTKAPLEVTSLTGLLMGGQGESDLSELTLGIQSIFKDLGKLKLNFHVHIDADELNLVKMTTQNTLDALQQVTDEEGKLAEKPEVTDEMVQRLLTEKYRSLIEPLRIQNQAPGFSISFGDNKALEVTIRDLNPDCLVLPLREISGEQFDDEIILKARMALDQKVSVLII